MCKKIDTCYKISIILDKVMEDFQYRECVKTVCAKCKYKVV
jgi:hypothetical protein